MRILLVTQDVLPAAGPRGFAGLAEALLSQGHEVSLIGPGAADLGDGKRLRPLGFLKPGKRMEAVLAAMAGREALRAAPEVALIEVRSSTSMIAAAVRALQVPFVLQFSTCILADLARSGTNPLRVEATRASLRMVANRAAATIATTDMVRRHIVDELGIEPPRVIEEGVDLTVARPIEPGLGRTRIKLPRELRMLSVVGARPADEHLALVAEAHRHLPGVGLIVASAESGDPFVEAMAFTARPSAPVVPHPEQPYQTIETIRAAEVCLCWGTADVPLEARWVAAMGRRQVLLDVPGSRDLAALYPASSGAVRLVREPTLPALREALEAAFEDERQQGPLPSEAVARAREALGWRHRADRIVAMFQPLTAHNRGSRR